MQTATMYRRASSADIQENNSPIPTRKRAIIYARVSTDRQERDGESLDYQEAKCRSYADLHDMDIVLVLHESKSGFIHYSLREKLTIARQMVRDHLADIIIVFDLRRFARNFVHSAMIFEEIESSGGEIVSVSENIDNSLTGKLIRSILAWSAESEREKILEYANRRWQTRVALGLPVGTGYAPYGWKWGDPKKTTYEIEPEQAAVRFSIFHMFVEEEMSLRAIAHKLTEDGIPTPTQSRWPDSDRSSLWTHTTLHDFLSDEANIGNLVICKRRKVLDEKGKIHRVAHPEKKVIVGGLPPIISPDLFMRAQRKLANNQVEASHLPKDPTLHLLRGHIRCDSCGQRMSMRIAHGHNNSHTPVYYCANRRNRYVKCADFPVIRADWIDPLVWAEVCQLFERLEVIQTKIEEELRKTVHTLLEGTKGEEQRQELVKALEFAQNEQAKHQPGSYYYNLLANDVRLKTEQLERYDTARHDSKEAEAFAASYHNRIMDFLNFLTAMRGKYEAASFQEKRSALDVLGVSVSYQPRTIEQRKRGKDATPDEIRRRTTVTYAPMFTGVQPSGEGRPQNQ